jgi:protein-S-isoprenylcysteine O-methyltransferase Ste14
MHGKIHFKRLEPLFLTLLALVFTIGLMFASVEIPRAVDSLLSQNVDFLDVATGQDELTAYKTELFLSHYNIRVIGYACLGVILILIVTGFVLEKHALASAGAILLFLPVFGHFAATMFFLGGLAFLRFLWLPFLDISFDVMRLGDIVLLPYEWILDGASLIGINLYRELPFIITGFGIFIFLLGVLAWMYGRIRNQNVTDFWIYRISRHPQYLGWIIWSYGMLFLPGANMKRYVDVANTLPWLLASMIIIGVAFLEERKMKQKYGETYEAFRQRAPFLFPLPRFIRKLFSLPLRLVFRKAYPDRKREIATVVTFYTALLIFLSAFSTGMMRSPKEKAFSEQKIESMVHKIKSSQNRSDIRNAASALAEIGGSAVDSLITLLDSDNVFVRWYCADELGNVKLEKTVQPLAALLNDPDPNVRRSAAGSLGGSGSDRAIQILIDAFLDSSKGVESSAARSLGRLKSEAAIPVLIQGLKSDHSAIVRSSAWALGEIGSS